MFDSYKEMKSFLAQIEGKPALLLHSCCAPCSSHVIFLLKDYFQLTIFYSNDNIYPLEEYEKRLKEEIDFCRQIDPAIHVISNEYCPKDYEEAVTGLTHLKERSMRCYQCYKLRLTKTVLKAKELGMKYFTTTLSISPYKVASWINEIGKELEKIYGVNFLYSDFKKEDGYKHSIALSKEYGLYRQDYCGCKYSLEERMEEHGQE